jgi:ankyrin repeat protein
MFKYCTDGCSDGVKKCLLSGCSPDIQCTQFWERGWTPIRYAALSGNKHDSEETLSKTMNMSTNIIGLLLNAGANVNQRDACGTTTLMSVAQFKRRGAIVSYLLANGARKDIKDNYNRTAYDYATSDKIRNILKN